jgi:L-alanine-DL-glutamate epimerase-like enolase superfamily enzyme
LNPATRIRHEDHASGTEVRDGMVHLNDKPGFGVEID